MGFIKALHLRSFRPYSALTLKKSPPRTVPAELGESAVHSPVAGRASFLGFQDFVCGFLAVYSSIAILQGLDECVYKAF